MINALSTNQGRQERRERRSAAKLGPLRTFILPRELCGPALTAAGIASGIAAAAASFRGSVDEGPILPLSFLAPRGAVWPRPAVLRSLRFAARWLIHPVRLVLRFPVRLLIPPSPRRAFPSARRSGSTASSATQAPTFVPRSTTTSSMTMPSVSPRASSFLLSSFSVTAQTTFWLTASTGFRHPAAPDGPRSRPRFTTVPAMTPSGSPSAPTGPMASG